MSDARRASPSTCRCHTRNEIDCLSTFLIIVLTRFFHLNIFWPQCSNILQLRQIFNLWMSKHLKRIPSWIYKIPACTDSRTELEKRQSLDDVQIPCVWRYFASLRTIDIYASSASDIEYRTTIDAAAYASYFHNGTYAKRLVGVQVYRQYQCRIYYKAFRKKKCFMVNIIYLCKNNMINGIVSSNPINNGAKGRTVYMLRTEK